MLTSQELHTLAFEFFQTFARFEYALKSCEYFKTTNKIDNEEIKTIAAEANWGAFSADVNLDSLTSQSEEIREATEYIFDYPPMKQVIEQNSQLKWIDALPTGGKNSRNLFCYIQRVRNNLFHGGKFNANNDWLDPVRSEKLISASLLI